MQDTHRPRTGSYSNELPFIKDRLDFWLTRFPALYLLVEEQRRWENWDKRVYLSVIERGDTIIDTGANVGAHTVAFSHMAGSAGRVIAFEPVPSSYARLVRTIGHRTRYPNVEAIRLAIGNPPDGPAEVRLKIPGGDHSQASLVEHDAGSWQTGGTVREHEAVMSSIDAESAALGLRRLDFLKIDVEGGELDAMKGAAAMLTNFKPLIYCELYEKWAASFGHTPDDVFAYLRALGYTDARVIRGGVVTALTADAQPPARLFSESADVLFIPPGREARVARFDKRYLSASRPSRTKHDG